MSHDFTISIKHVLRTAQLASSLLLLASIATAQISTHVASSGPEEAAAGVPLSFVVTLQQATAIDAVIFVYRSFGESEYHRIEMEITGNIARAVIPAGAVTPPFVEYYVVLRDRSGQLEAYPFSDSPDPLAVPPQNTRRIRVQEATGEEAQAVFLSPEPSSVFSPEDVLISVSLFRADSTILRKSTRLLLDGTEVTETTLFAGDLLAFAPANAGLSLSPGPHTATVLLLDHHGNIVHSYSTSFEVRGAIFTFAEPSSNLFQYRAALQLESRHEDVGTSSEWYNRVTGTFRGGMEDLRIQSNLFITSDEKTSRQPQNRYFIGAELPGVTLGLGDVTPQFPSLILSGKRVRGINSSVRFGDFALDLVYGSVTRAVEGSQLKTIPLDSLLVEQTRDPNSAYAQITPTTWGKFSYGTYGRTLFALRPSIGSGDHWRLGLTWLSAKDDPNSIRFGIRPQENIVFGSDFHSKLDDGRVEISWEVALSAFNSDISSGNFNDAYIDSVYPNQSGAIKSARDLLQPFITVNENLRPLSFKKLATLGGEAGLALNYLENAVRITYLYRGADYNSFGQTYLRTDIRGFNVLDRIRLLRNQLFATLGYERLQDNTAATRSATTTFSTLNAALSLVLPLEYPSLTIGYSRFDNDNKLPADSLSSIRDVTNRLYFESAYSFTASGYQTLLVGYSSSVRDDRSPRAQDISSHVFSLGLTSRFSVPLQTTLSFSLNLNDLPGDVRATTRTFNYTILTMHGSYQILREVLTVMATLGPTFGDFHRTVIDGAMEWHFLPGMSLLLQGTSFQNSGMSAESVFSLLCRYSW
jgi:hypothetical protein